MVVRTPRPFRKEDGSLWLRVRVLKDLWGAFGKREHHRSLGTRDWKKAEAAHADALKSFRSKCDNLRNGPQRLSEREAQQIAAPVFLRWCGDHRDNPSFQRKWRTELFSDLWSDFAYGIAECDFVGAPGQSPQVAPLGVPGFLEFTMRPASEMRRLAEAEADELVDAQGLILDKASYRTLARAVARAIQRACLELEKLASGEIDDLHLASLSEPVGKPQAVAPTLIPLRFHEIFEGWKAESKPRDKTVYEWKRAIQRLEKFVGFDDPRRLSREDIVRWKDEMVQAELSAKTINDGYLTAVKTILQWGVENGRLQQNAATNVRVRQREKSGGRREFTDEEAAVIIRAALRSTTPEKKWIPILQCFSGARVIEVSHLRREDIEFHGSFATMSFVFEAGSLKTKSSERTVPIHPSVLDAGFREFVTQTPSGPLFADLRLDRFGRRNSTASKVIGPWIRGLGIVDPRVGPNHSWRHRLITQGRLLGIPEDISAAITGHAIKNVGGRYGRFPLEVLHREILKLPDINTLCGHFHSK